MNGPRTLSNEHLSYLVISEPQPSDSTGDLGEYDLLMCAPHFTGDGSSLHQSTHELFSLLSSPKSEAALTEELMSMSNWVSPIWMRQARTVAVNLTLRRSKSCRRHLKAGYQYPETPSLERPPPLTMKKLLREKSSVQLALFYSTVLTSRVGRAYYNARAARPAAHGSH